MTDKQGNENWDDVVEEETAVEVADPEVELDPEDGVNVPQYYYTTQTDFEQDGEVIPAGTKIPVKCKYCAVWETPLAVRGDRPLCGPGVKTGVTIAGAKHRWRMNEDRYSCQAHFVPKDIGDVLTYITADPVDVQMLQWTFPIVKHLVKLQERIRRYYKSKNLEGAEKAVDNAIDFATLFTSQEQADYVRPYVNSAREAIKAAKKSRIRRGSQFRAGDEVEWDNTAGAGRVRGFISSIGGAARLMTLMVHGENVQLLDPGNTSPALLWKRPQVEWLKLNPKLLGATPVVVMDADEEE